MTELLRRRRRTAHAAVACAAAALLLLVGAGYGRAAGGFSWSVTTASAGFGSDRQNYDYTLNRGGRIEDALVIVNHGRGALNLAVYAADAYTTDQGKLDLEPQDATPVGIGAWVHAASNHVTVAAGKSLEVPFTLTVPEGAAPGDHVGGIVTSLKQQNVERRLGIRIRLRVGGGALEPTLAVEHLKLSYSGSANPLRKGDATLSYTIHNTGNAVLAARQAVSLSGPFGRFRVHAGHVGDTPPLLPGEMWRVSVPIDGVAPTLRVSATATLTPLLTDAAGSITPLAATNATTHAWAIPWTLLLIVIITFALLGTGLALVPRRQASAPRTPSVTDDAAHKPEPSKH